MNFITKTDFIVDHNQMLKDKEKLYTSIINNKEQYQFIKIPSKFKKNMENG